VLDGTQWVKKSRRKLVEACIVLVAN